MSIRLRRNRLLIVSIVSILSLLYWIQSYSGDVHDDEGASTYRRRAADVIVREVTVTTTTETRTRVRREEIVEIGGKRIKKIDWHDYELIARDNARTGVGEQGAGVEPSAQERSSADFQQLYRANGFNAFISNNISLDRSLKDIRHPE